MSFLGSVCVAALAVSSCFRSSHSCVSTLWDFVLIQRFLRDTFPAVLAENFPAFSIVFVSCFECFASLVLSPRFHNFRPVLMPKTLNGCVCRMEYLMESDYLSQSVQISVLLKNLITNFMFYMGHSLLIL